MSLLTYFDKVRVVIRAHQNRVRSMFFEFFVDGRGGSILTYCDKVRVVICAHQNRVHYIFLEFLLTVKGRGDP